MAIISICYAATQPCHSFPLLLKHVYKVHVLPEATNSFFFISGQFFCFTQFFVSDSKDKLMLRIDNVDSTYSVLIHGMVDTWHGKCILFVAKQLILLPRFFISQNLLYQGTSSAKKPKKKKQTKRIIFRNLDLFKNCLIRHQPIKIVFF